MVTAAIWIEDRCSSWIRGHLCDIIVVAFGFLVAFFGSTVQICRFNGVPYRIDFAALGFDLSEERKITSCDFFLDFAFFLVRLDDFRDGGNHDADWDGEEANVLLLRL